MTGKQLPVTLMTFYLGGSITGFLLCLSLLGGNVKKQKALDDRRPCFFSCLSPDGGLLR